MGAHPWFNPLWRRVAVTLFCVGWTAFEAWNDPAGIWPWLFGAITIWAVWDFFLAKKYPVKG